MKYSNELKVGATIVIATIVFILGLRYFQDLPLFSSTYELVAEFDQASGLIAGNTVRINGVSVGSVNDVYINPESQRVRVDFHVTRDVTVTEGTTAQIAGFDALGAVRLDLHLGPIDAPRIPPGGLVLGVASSDVLGELSAKAPELVDQVDLVLSNLNRVLGEAGTMMTEPNSDIRQTLVSVQNSAETLDHLLTSERDRLGRILENVESFSGNLDRLSSENADSLTALVGGLNGTLTHINSSLVSLETMSGSLTELLQKINDGEGTLGLFVNDPGVYQKLDSVLANLDHLLIDFRNHPDRYLKELRLVDIF